MNTDILSPATFYDLPDELILRVFTYLPQIDLIKCISRVNKKLHVLSRSSYLWKHLDFRNFEVEPKDLRHFSKQKLVGRQTCSVKIEFNPRSKNIEAGLAPVFKICGVLTHILIRGGSIHNFQNFIRLFSDYLEKLELIETVAKNRLVGPESLPSVPRFSLKYLKLSDSSWLYDVHLSALIGLNASKTLKYLNVSKCYRLFLGPPASCPLNVRFEKMSAFLKQTCPHLEELNLSSVFMSHNIQVPVTTALLSMIPDTLPYLHTLNLSENPMITSSLLNQLYESQNLSSALQSFITSFFNKIHKYKVFLYIYDWPHKLTMSLFSACALTVPDGSTVYLYVNDAPECIEENSKCKLISSVTNDICFG
ncbi:unnamed protein product [Schistosoma intercalatum]|nr:unnamed protein product [Schistosoma intercalatum]